MLKWEEANACNVMEACLVLPLTQTLLLFPANPHSTQTCLIILSVPQADNCLATKKNKKKNSNNKPSQSMNGIRIDNNATLEHTVFSFVQYFLLGFLEIGF